MNEERKNQAKQRDLTTHESFERKQDVILPTFTTLLSDKKSYSTRHSMLVVAREEVSFQ